MLGSCANGIACLRKNNCNEGSFECLWSDTIQWWLQSEKTDDSMLKRLSHLQISLRPVLQRWGNEK